MAARRNPVLGPHQKKIVRHLSEGAIQSGDLRKKTKLTKGQFEPALRRLAKRKVVHVTRKTMTAADGEVFKLEGRAIRSTVTSGKQVRRVVLNRIYQGRKVV